jgi:hypothetical protein
MLKSVDVHGSISDFRVADRPRASDILTKSRRCSLDILLGRNSINGDNYQQS